MSHSDLIRGALAQLDDPATKRMAFNALALLEREKVNTCDLADLNETLVWIKDWRDDMFSSTSRDQHGWPIEMHGLAASYETLAAEYMRIRSALEEIHRTGRGIHVEIARDALNT